MNTRAIVDTYYELANAGDWEAWCDLFAPDQIMDEQLVGRIKGRDALRNIMKGFPDMYARFTNVPRFVVVDGEQAAVVSHISAATHAGVTIEADVSNYFRIVGDQITYLANFHDTVPFVPALAR